MNQYVKKLLPHLGVIALFILASLIYFNPVLKGEQIYQNDIVQHNGMAKQQRDYRAATGEETYWTNSTFGGMPTYALGARYPHNYIKKLDETLRFLPRPADYVFLYFMGFYILLLTLKVDFKLAALGALAFGFSTYLIIILGVGHNSKAHAIAYMPLVLAGILLAFQKRYLYGFLLTSVAMALEIGTGHYQMTYYLMLLVIVLGIVYLIDAYKKQLLPHFFKTVCILLLAVVLAIGLNATNLMATQEYVKESTRGKSELTIHADGTPKEATSGLSKEYITEYSYGLLETFNLFIPRFMGGGGYEDVGKDSNTYKLFRDLGASPVQARNEVKQTPTYWGKQPIVEAPAYVGAVSLFLFVFALFLVKGRLKWWLVGGTLMSWILSWGKNWFWGPEGNPSNNPITNFMIDYFPLYDKFRAVSSIQVILELCIPALGIFALVRLFNDFEKHEQKLKALKYTTIITGGLALVFLLFSGGLDFVSPRDGRFMQMYGEIGPQYMDAVKEDRQAFFRSDTLRTLILVLLSAGTILAFLKGKLKETIVIVIFAGLILFDLVGVDKRYVNNDDFMTARRIKQPFQLTSADKDILKDKSHFRVLDLSTNPFASGRTSYFHNALGGYHAAKPGRVQDVMDFHIQNNNLQVLNMMNIKYIIQPTEEGSLAALTNPDANGNAWFIDSLKKVETADQEIKALDSLHTKRQAVILSDAINTLQFIKDSTAVITLKEVKPNYLKYNSNNSNTGFAVFSENYYANGWNAYINGELQPHYRVNYLLRGMEIPSGKHTIEFKFEPEVVKTGSKITLASSILLGLVILGSVFLNWKMNKSV